MPTKASFSRCWTFVFTLAVLAVGYAAYYFLIIRNPLPSDEEMIAHFYAHRADFEELVRRYREYDRPSDKDTSFWYKEGDTLDLYKRASILDVEFSAPVWFTFPYTLGTAIEVEERMKKDGRSLFHKYGALSISLSPRQKYRIITPRYTVIWKNFYFFPEEPRIKDGKLFWPLNIKGNYSKQRRTFPSLNRFPNQWKDFECVYRKIESHWFLSMCNGH